MNIYRPPASNIQSINDELSNILDKSSSKYDSIIVMGDINIDTTEAKQAKLANVLLKELCITYDLSNVVIESTCITYTYENSIDVILTNRKQNFLLTKAVETGLSDFHKMVTTFMRNTYSRQEPIKIYYRKVYSKWSYAFLDLQSSECTCARKTTCFVSRII